MKVVLFVPKVRKLPDLNVESIDIKGRVVGPITQRWGVCVVQSTQVYLPKLIQPNPVKPFETLFWEVSVKIAARHGATHGIRLIEAKRWFSDFAEKLRKLWDLDRIEFDMYPEVQCVTVERLGISDDSIPLKPKTKPMSDIMPGQGVEK